MSIARRLYLVRSNEATHTHKDDTSMVNRIKCQNNTNKTHQFVVSMEQKKEAEEPKKKLLSY